MLEEVLEMLANMFLSLFALVDKIYTKFNAWSLILGAFIVYTLYRVLLRPVLGSAVSSGASDTVQKMKSSRQQPQAVSGLEKKG